MNIKRVLIVGSGTMGQQIGLQFAMKGFETIMFDASDEVIAGCRAAQEAYLPSWQASNPGATSDEVAAGLARLSYSSDLTSAAADVDLVNESVPENLEIKQAVYSDLSRYCRPDTILTTNTSTFVPSDIAPFVDAPERFLALHFGNPVWAAPIAEVMGHPTTRPEIFERMLELGRELSMLPIRLDQEQPGYIINTLLQPWLIAGIGMVANGVATHQDVDRTWMMASGMKQGPFGALDNIGAVTAYNVCLLHAELEPDNPQHMTNASFVKENLIDKGTLGVSTGQGYYSYPDPEYAQPDFLR